MVFIDWYLPGYKAGGPIRSMANMISALKSDYVFYVVCRNSDYLESKPYPNTIPYEWNQLSDNEFVYYISNNSVSVKTIRNVIKSKEFDLVYVNGIWSFYFSILPVILSKRLKIKRIVVASRGMLSQQSIGVKTLKKKLFVFVSRILGLYKKTEFHVTSKEEEAEIKSLSLRQQKIVLLPNFPPPVQETDLKRPEKPVGELRLVSIARIAPEKNTLFAIECLSERKFKGNIIFDLFGSVYNLEYWEKCQEAVSKLPSNIQVNYWGEIENHLVFGVFQEYHFLFLPTKGENFGHSILESFISGCPVIISNTTPWKNLKENKLGWEIELLKELFAKIIQTALDMEDDEYRDLCESCRSYAQMITENRELKVGYRSFL